MISHITLIIPNKKATRSAMLTGRYAWRTGMDYAFEVGSMFGTDSEMTRLVVNFFHILQLR